MGALCFIPGTFLTALYFVAGTCPGTRRRYSIPPNLWEHWGPEVRSEGGAAARL